MATKTEKLRNVKVGDRVEIGGFTFQVRSVQHSRQISELRLYSPDGHPSTLIGISGAKIHRARGHPQA